MKYRTLYVYVHNHDRHGTCTSLRIPPPSNHSPLSRCFLPWDAETGRFMLMRVDIMNQTTRCFTANVFHI